MHLLFVVNGDTDKYTIPISFRTFKGHRPKSVFIRDECRIRSACTYVQSDLAPHYPPLNRLSLSMEFDRLPHKQFEFIDLCNHEQFKFCRKRLKVTTMLNPDRAARFMLSDLDLDH